MLALFAGVIVVIVALTIAGFALHLLFTPWVLLAAVGVFAWLKLRPSRARR